MKKIDNLGEFNDLLQEKEAVLAYFSHENCSVCKTLKPKLFAHFENHFPKFELSYIDIKLSPEIAAANSVFTVPVIIVFFEGKEYIRKARSMGIGEISDEVERPYQLMFS